MVQAEMTGLAGNQFDSEFFSAIARQLGVTGLSGEQRVPTCLLRLGWALASIDARQSGRPSRLDLAVLIRQCLRNNDSQSDFQAATRIRVPQGPSWPTVQEWDMVGMSAVPSEDGTTIQAKPWLPGLVARRGIWRSRWRGSVRKPVQKDHSGCRRPILVPDSGAWELPESRPAISSPGRALRAAGFHPRGLPSDRRGQELGISSY